jgi:ornithine decarboxylase
MRTDLPEMPNLTQQNAERLLRRRALAERYLPGLETFLLLDPTEIDSIIEYFRVHLPHVTPLYAIKANNHSSILHRVAAAGWGFDAASHREVQEALKSGVDSAKVILANPVKSVPTLRSIFDNNLGWYTFDTRCELEKLARYVRDHKPNHRPIGLCRIRVPSKGVQTDLGEKFGCTPEEGVELLLAAHALDLPIGGVSFHVGTQSRDVTNYETGLALAESVLEKVYQRSGIRLRTVDIGGGFPVDSANALGTTELFFRDLGRITRSADQRGLQILAEPGRVLCGAAGTLVSTIIGKSQRFGKPWLHLSDGVYGSYSGVLFDHQRYCYFPVASRFYSPPFSELVETTLCGPTCDSMDVIARSVLLPADLMVGDALFTPDIGAYSSASATHFNGFTPPKIVEVAPQCSLPSRAVTPRSTLKGETSSLHWTYASL